MHGRKITFHIITVTAAQLQSTSKYDEVLKRVELSIEAIASSCFKLIKNMGFGVLVLVPSI